MRGSSETKVENGKLVKIDVQFSDRIEKVSITGDFFVQPPDAVEDLEKALEGQDVTSTVEELVEKLEMVEADLIGFDRRDVAETLKEAMRNEWNIIDGEARSEPMHHALDQVLTEKVASGEIGPTLRFWHRESAAVPFGRYQSFEDEVEEEYVEEQDIETVRRITGGGAMYAEPGRVITYSMYLPEEMVPEDFEESYRTLDSWAVEVLGELGIEAEYEPVNDIVAEDGKLGGAAQLRKNGAVLHHTMISHSMDTENMLKALRIGKEKVSDKAIKSAEKRVATLHQYVEDSRREVLDTMKEKFVNRFGGEETALPEKYVEEAEELAEEKFRSSEWNRKL